MDGDPEALRHASGQVGRSAGRILRQERLQERHDARGHLVAAARPSLSGEEARQAAFLEGALRLIERRARQMEGRRGWGHGLGVNLHAPEHLVFHLDDVPGVEELVGTEDGVGDVVAPSIERPVRPQGLDLGIASSEAGRGWSLHVSCKLRHLLASCQAARVSLLRHNPFHVRHSTGYSTDGATSRTRCPAFLTLHIRHNSLDTPSVPSGASVASWPPPCNQVAQAQQIRRTTQGAAGRNQDIRVQLVDIRPRHGDGGEDTSAVVIEDAALAPGVLDGHELEGPPGQRMEGVGDAEDSRCKRTISCI